jgi:hypothetical protein
MAQEKSTDATDSVFDRLSNPSNYTGTQKYKSISPRKEPSTVTSPRSLKTNDQSTPESVFERLSSPRNYTGIHKAKLEEKAKSPRKQDENKQDTLSPRPNPTQSTSGESVFERLASPRNYTGTQKAKLEEQQTKSPRKTEILNSPKKEATSPSTTDENDVFARLSNPANYTMATKYRFNSASK